ncbi:MAG: hypothetical protein WBA67_06815, partial [Jannaschia sp.]
MANDVVNVGPWSQAEGLPDGIRSAIYADPTNVYGHRIMGDNGDANVLRAWIGPGRDLGGCGDEVRVEAGAGHVFEDIAPRLADVDGD